MSHRLDEYVWLILSRLFVLLNESSCAVGGSTSAEETGNPPTHIHTPTHNHVDLYWLSSILPPQTSHLPLLLLFFNTKIKVYLISGNFCATACLSFVLLDHSLL